MGYDVDSQTRKGLCPFSAFSKAMLRANTVGFVTKLQVTGTRRGDLVGIIQ